MTGREGTDATGLSAVGVEALDTPTLDRTTARATLTDIARANLLFGGNAAVAHGVKRILGDDHRRSTLTIADVGAGAGDVLQSLTRMLTRRGIAATGIAVDWHREAAAMAREQGQGAAVGDAFALPLASRSIDVVVASQLLHHFSRDAAIRLLRELDRVARMGVVISDLRRARTAAWGIWLAASIMRFHPVSRADGVLSVRRGFSARELADLCRDAGVSAAVTQRPGYRLLAYWRTDRAHG